VESCVNRYFLRQSEQHQASVAYHDFWILLARFSRRRSLGFVGAPGRFDEQVLPIHVDRARAGRRVGNFGNRSALPANYLIERRHSLSTGSSRVTDLPFLKENLRFFAARPDELHYCGRATHAFKLNNVGELEIAESALKFFRRLVLGATQQMLDQIDKIPLHQRLLEKMNRAESGDLFPLLGQMNAG